MVDADGGGQIDPQQLMASYTKHDELADLQGLSLHSSPVKPSSSSGRASSSEPSSGKSLPMFVQQEDEEEDLDDDDDDEGRKSKKGIPNPGRRKIEIEYIEDKVSETRRTPQDNSQTQAKETCSHTDCPSYHHRANDISHSASAKRVS